MNNNLAWLTTAIRKGAIKFFEKLPTNAKLKLINAYIALLKKANSIHCRRANDLINIIAKNGGFGCKNSVNAGQRRMVMIAQLKLTKLNTKTKLISEQLAELISVKTEYSGLQYF